MLLWVHMRVCHVVHHSYRTAIVNHRRDNHAVDVTLTNIYLFEYHEKLQRHTFRPANDVVAPPSNVRSLLDVERIALVFVATHAVISSRSYGISE